MVLKAAEIYFDEGKLLLVIRQSRCSVIVYRESSSERCHLNTHGYNRRCFARDAQSFDLPLQKVKDLLLTPKVVLKDSVSQSPNCESDSEVDLGSSRLGVKEGFWSYNHGHGCWEVYTENKVTR